jgi:two-component system response regulator YcbB
MVIYIIEDDETMIEILEDLIEEYELGDVAGSTTDPFEAIRKVPEVRPDIILVDFLMPGMDGAELVKKLRNAGCRAAFIMLSQVSSKDMIGKAYDAGIEFFINKPINLIELKSVLTTVARQIKNERTVNTLRNLFMSEIGESAGALPAGEAAAAASMAQREQTPDPQPQAEPQPKAPAENQGDEFTKSVEKILALLGMAGEKGSGDIIRVCAYLKGNSMSMQQENVRIICGELSDAPKSMEQRMRRAVKTGLTNLAHLGIEDFMNDTFTDYSSTLFPFEEVRTEMDFIRGKRAYGGKVSLKKFIESLMIQADRMLSEYTV